MQGEGNRNGTPAGHPRVISWKWLKELDDFKFSGKLDDGRRAFKATKGLTRAAARIASATPIRKCIALIGIVDPVERRAILTTL